MIKAVDDHGPLTGTGQFIGTIDYVAPEQIQGDPAKATSDCYALTGVLFECLTGQVPFPRPNEAATLHAHVLQPPPKLSDVRPELPV
jgi:serine/threonine protein kinase